MNLFKSYLYSLRKIFIYAGIVSLLFFLVFRLYHLPMTVLLYLFILAAFFGLIFLAYDYTLFRKNYIDLKSLSKCKAELLDCLPNANTVTEQVYQEIIQNLLNEVKELQSQMSRERQETNDYFSIWVHQIKTPISSIELALHNEDSELSRSIRSELFRIEQYVEMVLAYLRLESSSTDYVFRKTDLDFIIKRSVAKFATEFINRKIQLKLETIDKSLVTDEKWFAFVIEQIISNALKYTPRGSINIYMSDPETLCIKDSGIGIASEDLPRIFERGFTGFNGRIDKKSSGLGLFLCKKICKNLDIGINIESQLNEGTIVMLSLKQNTSSFD